MYEHCHINHLSPMCNIGGVFLQDSVVFVSELLEIIKKCFLDTNNVGVIIKCSMNVAIIKGLNTTLYNQLTEGIPHISMQQHIILHIHHICLNYQLIRRSFQVEEPIKQANISNSTLKKYF